MPPTEFLHLFGRRVLSATLTFLPSGGDRIHGELLGVNRRYLRGTRRGGMTRRVEARRRDGQQEEAMSDLEQDRQLVISVFRLIPTYRRSSWMYRKHCRIRAGWYDDEQGQRVFVPEQFGEILRWSYLQWDGKDPLAIKMYVRVRLRQSGLGT
jgi:hypothetical protein